MAYEIGTASNYTDLLNKLRKFACGHGTCGTPAFTGAGNGIITGLEALASAVTETWTLTCTAAATNSGTFSVVGSVSGAKAALTVGVAYDNGFFACTVTDGGVDYHVGDVWTFTTTQGVMKAAGQEWQQLRWTGGTDLILKGLGNSRDKEIYFGISAFLYGADSYQWEMRGMTGFSSGVSGMAGQPGASSPVYNHFHGTTMSYWFIGNGQRLIWIVKVSTTYQHGYAGFFLPYATPAQYPYPLAIGGCSKDSNRRWSDTSTRDHSAYWNPGQGCLWLYWPDGSWREVRNRFGTGAAISTSIACMWPWQLSTVVSSVNYTMNFVDQCPDGSDILLPGVMHSPAGFPSANNLGELDGIAFITGKGQSSENTVTVGGDTWLVFQNIFRNAYDDFVAIKRA